MLPGLSLVDCFFGDTSRTGLSRSRMVLDGFFYLLQISVLGTCTGSFVLRLGAHEPWSCPALSERVGELCM